MSREAAIRALLLDKINMLFETTGVEISPSQFQGLYEHYLSSSATTTQIAEDIEQRFAAKLAYFNHEQHRAAVIENYKNGVNPLTDKQNYYLVSYNLDGQKVIKPAKVEASNEDLDPNQPKRVMIDDNPQRMAQHITNNQGVGYLDDLTMIYNQIGFLLDINLAKTHRVFNDKMEPQGLLIEDFPVGANERFFTFLELAKIVINNSTNEVIKSRLMEYLKMQNQLNPNEVNYRNTPELYRAEIEFILDVILGLPQITPQNQNGLKKEFLAMKIMEIFSGSIDNTAATYGIIVNSGNKPYNYRFGALYDQTLATQAEVTSEPQHLNNFLVNKRELFRMLVTFYYPLIKTKVKMILANKDDLLAAINSIAQDFLDYGVFQEYKQIVNNNYQMMAEETVRKRELDNSTLEERMAEATNNEIAGSRSQAMQRGTNIRKAKTHTLTLQSGPTPPLILDDNGKIDKKFAILTTCLLFIIIYMAIMVMVY